jgi:PAS domain S-box-containing protein
MNSFPSWLKTVLALAVLALLAGGLLFYHVQEQRVRQDVESNLKVITEFKVNEIVAWRADQLAEGSELMASLFFVEGTAQWLADPQSNAATEILSRFRSLQKHYLYRDVFLVDAGARVRLSLSGRLGPLEADSAQALSAALRDRKPKLTDLHADELDSTPHISVVAPLFVSEGETQKPLGAVVLVCDARQYLYPLIQSWPVPSETAETLLVRREGDDVFFLNDLRRQSNAALKLRIPLSQTNVPAVMAVLGKEGVVQGKDYHGVEVLAVLKHIPDSSWFMVAKMDAAEAFASWQFRSILILALLLVLVALAGAAVLVVWQRNRKAHYRALYRAEVTRLASEKRYGVTLKSIGDAVIATDAKGRLELLNPVAETLTGWTNEEARGRPLAEVFRIINEETRQPVENPVARVMREGVVVGLANHTALIARNGTEFPIADAGAPIRDEQNEIIGVVLVFRNQSEERAMQRALRESQALYHSLVEQLPAGVFRKDAEGRYVFVNSWFCRLKSVKAELFLGKKPQEVAAAELAAGSASPDQINRLATQGTDHNQQIMQTGRRIEAEEHGVDADGKEQHLYVVKSPMFGSDGKIVGSQGVLFDITERKRIEETLKHERNLFRTILDNLPSIIFFKDRDGRYVLSNQAHQRVLGSTQEAILGKTAFDFHPPDLARQYLEDEMQIMRTGEPLAAKEELALHREIGEHRWHLTSRIPLKDESGHVVGVFGISHDITERKRAEGALRESQALYHSLVEQLPAGIFRKNKEGRYVFVNSWLCRFRGVKAEHYLGKTPQEVEAAELARLGADRGAHPRLGAQGASHHELVMRTGRQIEVEEEWPGQDGKRHRLHVTKSPVFDLDGTIVGTQGIMFDITERKQAEEALRESQALHHSFVEQLPNAVFRKDSEGRYVMVNSQFCRLKGLKAEDFLGRKPVEVAKRESAKQGESGQATKYAAQGEEVHELIMLTGKVVETEEEYPAADGGKQFMHVMRMPVFGPDGTVVGTQGILFDITPRKRTEEEVDRTAREWQTTFDATNDAIWILDQEHRVLRTNKTAERIFQRQCGEMLGKHCYEIVHGTTEPIPGCPLNRARKNMRRETTDLKIGGGWFEVIVDPILDSAGQYAGAVHIVSDITSRKQAEERIREQAALLDAANDAIYVRALNHTVTYWNDGAERLYGWTRAEVLGRKIDDLISYDAGAFKTAQAALLAQGSWSGEVKMTSKAGKEIVVFCRWTLLRDEQGQPKEVLAINTDITEQKQLETNFLRAQRLEGIGALAGGIAHDLNNILQPILMTAALLRETVGDSESREMLDTMNTCAQRGADIIKQLLTFARGKPGARVPLPIRHLLNELNKLIHETFPRNIQLRVSTPKDLWLVLGDATQVHQALMNLCVNARDAMPDGGTLTLVAENLTLDEAFAAMMPGAKPGPYVCVSVADTGTGIPPENLDRIFDPFFTTKEIGKGTGLGLATVLGIVRGHGGFVRVNSRVGHGTTFELYLPASSEPKAAATSGREALPPRADGELIMVVDDEASVRGVVQRALEKHGYRVVAAAEGAEAMALFTQHRAEVRAILTDMMMPGMDGPSLVRTLRRQKTQLPILGMTGLGERVDIKGLESLNLLVLLTKPFTSAVLLAVLRRALAAPRAAGGKTAKPGQPRQPDAGKKPNPG